MAIHGRASYMNAAPLGTFFKRALAQKKFHFLLDFERCTGMDSTFLGLLAGIAMDVLNAKPKGNITLCRLSSRNLELVRNLGLHRILTVDAGDFPMHFDSEKATALNSSAATPQKILEAHENLSAMNAANKRKFQDVVAYLKNEVENND